MRIVDIREKALPISRYEGRTMSSSGLTTSIVALVTDVVRDGKPIIGYGFSSVGRYAQSGLIRDRFAPRLMSAEDLADDAGATLDPFRAWKIMMKNEKQGGHGERCVAVGTLDMAIWDASAKIANLPLHLFIRLHLHSSSNRDSDAAHIHVYAAGGYLYPSDDISRLRDEILRMQDQGYTRFKIKIGAMPLAQDLKRIDAVLRLLRNPNYLAVDAMNAYGAEESLQAASALGPYGLWWFEDVCDPLDFETLAAVAKHYEHPVAAGEALFSEAEAKLLDRYGGLRQDRDILVFDPVHCYGLTEYLRITKQLQSSGWPQSAFWPHGGHLFCLHVVAALGLGGAEVNPLAFQPVCGLAGAAEVVNGKTVAPDAPGIGFELRPELWRLFAGL